MKITIDIIILGTVAFDLVLAYLLYKQIKRRVKDLEDQNMWLYDVLSRTHLFLIKKGVLTHDDVYTIMRKSVDNHLRVEKDNDKPPPEMPH